MTQESRYKVSSVVRVRSRCSCFTTIIPGEWTHFKRIGGQSDGFDFRATATPAAPSPRPPVGWSFAAAPTEAAAAAAAEFALSPSLSPGSFEFLLPALGLTRCCRRNVDGVDWASGAVSGRFAVSASRIPSPRNISPSSDLDTRAQLRSSPDNTLSLDGKYIHTCITRTYAHTHMPYLVTLILRIAVANKRQWAVEFPKKI